MPFAKVTLVTASQPLKAATPRLVTVLGIVIVLSLLHCAKALSPIIVTPSGIAHSVKLLQLEKANCSIFVMFVGNFNVVRAVSPVNI